MMQWIQDNFNTLFSGLGVYVISILVSGFFALIGFVFYRKGDVNKVRQNNITAGGDVVGRDKKG